MNDLKELVEEIDVRRLMDDVRRAAVAERPDWDMVRDMAAQYSELCSAANERLVECHDLLLRGLRTEAIQQCEREPAILEIIEFLDFPEYDSWCCALLAQQMTLPPELKIDLAVDLNEAYAAEQSLSDLLKKHRLLALGHAELSSRIAVLRTIEAKDPDNPAWQRDLADYERVRIKEIHSQLLDAERNGNGRLAESLHRELTKQHWHATPDSQVVALAARITSHLAQKRARNSLSIAERRLNDAYAALDPAAAREAAELWSSELHDANLPSDHPLLDKVEPALAWLADQEQQQEENTEYEQLCRQLKEALDDQADVLELEQIRGEIQRLERELPMALEERYQSRVAVADLGRRRRFMAVMVSLVAVVVILTIAIVMAIRHQQYRHQVAAAAASLRTLIDANDFDGAARTYTRLQQDAPALSNTPELLALKSEMDRKRKAEASRAAAFREAVSRFKKAGWELPDEDALRRAESLARLVAEKTEVQDCRATLTRHQAEQQRARDERFMTELKPIQASLKRLDDVTNTDDKARQALLAKVKSDLKRLATEHPHVSAHITDQTKLIRQRLETIESDLAIRRQRRDLLNQMARDIPHLDQFVRTAEDYMKRYPESSLAVDLKQVLKEQPAWKSTLRWAEFLISKPFQNLDDLSPQEAAQAIETGRRLVQDSGMGPSMLVDGFVRRQEILDRIAARVDRGQPIVNSLIKLRQDSFISDIWMVQTADQKRYYMTKKADLEHPDATNRCVINFIQAPDYTSKRLSIRVVGIMYDDVSPQTKLIEKMVPRLRDMKPSAWDSTFLDIIKEMHDDEHLDPILKYLLLMRTLDIACQGSFVLDSTFSDYLNQMKSTQVDTRVNWLDPDNEDAANLRLAVTSLLKRMPDVEQARKQATEAKAKLLATLPQTVTWVGMLTKNESRAWTCQPEPRNQIGTFYVVVTEASDAKPHLKKVGSLNQGQVHWDEPFDGRFLQGRPLFWEKKTP